MRKPEIERVFDMYNAVLFGGRLQLPNIMVRRMRDCARWYEPEPQRDRGDYVDSHNLGLGLLILSSTAFHKFTWRATLLHEMIHMAVPVEDIDPHGPLFVAECNRVADVIGLDHVEPEDAWNWPSHHLDDEPADEQNILDED